MSKKVFYASGLGFLLAWPVLAIEQPPAPYPQSELEKEVVIDSAGHLVLFSPVREVNSQIRSERMARLPVQGIGQLHLVSADSGRDEARSYYERQLQQRGAQILFECSGRDCGRSNVWANQVFSERKLYGRDADQDYLVAASTDEDNQVWLTLLYTVTRGNRREYVWVEHLGVSEGAAVPGLERADARILGPLIVPWEGGFTYSFDWSTNDRRTLTDWAREEGARVVLTSFSRLEGEENVEESMDRARQAAESLSLLLEQSGVGRDQQLLITVGPAVVFTDPGRQGNHVEVVVIKGR